MKNRRQVLVAAVVLFLCAIPALAQSSTSLNGRVADQSGSLIPGAKVQADNLDTNLAYSATSNVAGVYSIATLPPGTYRIIVEKDGFQRAIRSNVELHVASTVVIDFDLQVGAVTQSVEVTAGAPLVNTTTSSLSGLVQTNQLESLPLNGRNYINLTLLQPGIVVNPNTNTSPGSYRGTWYSSNGAPVRSNNFSLDGATLQDATGGTTSNYIGRTLGLDGVQEYRVMTNSYSAEYGPGVGSQTIMVSKSGTNRFHGTAFEYLRNSVLDAANFFDKPTAANGFKRLPQFQRNNFGGSFGGPIRRDKTFFFATFEAVHERLGQTILDTVPGAGCHGAAGATITNTACPQLGTATPSVTIAPVVAPLLALFPVPNLPNNVVTVPFTQPDTNNYGQIRVDNSFSSKDSAFVRYTIDQDDNKFAQAYPQYFVLDHSGRHQFGTVAETHIFTPRLVNTLRVSVSRISDPTTSPNSLVGPQYSMVTGLALGQVSIGGVNPPLLPSGQFSGGNQTILSFSDDVMYTVGAHSLKFGTLISSWRQFSSSGLSNRNRGMISFASIATFLKGQPSNYSIQTPASLDRTMQFYELGFYAQDDWRLRSNVTVNVGLRYEPVANYLREVHGLSSALVHLSDPSFIVGPVANNPTKLAFTPRFGLAWDVRGNGKTAIRAGVALLRDITNLNNPVFTNVLAAQPPFSGISTQSNISSFTLPLAFPSAVASKSVATLEYNLKQSRLFTGNFAVEQQLPFSMVLSTAYAYSRGMHLFASREGNPNVPTFVNGLPVWPTNAALLTRVNPAFADTYLVCACADSTYNALQISLTKRMTKGLQFQNSFTWSKTIDNAQASRGDTTASSAYQTNPFNGRFDRGVSSFNIPRVWVSNVLYNLPSPKNGGVLGALTSGWAMAGILTLRDGLAFNPGDVAQRSNSGIAGGSTGNGPIDRPNWNPAFKGPVITGDPAQWYNPNAFMLQPAGTLGNVARNSLRGPSYKQLDFSLRKDTKLKYLGESGSLQFRAEVFNIFNHPNLGMPNNNTFAGTLTDPVTVAPLASAGQITNTLGTSRQIEFSLRISF